MNPIVQPLFDLPFLQSQWDTEFRAYLADGGDAEVRGLLAQWAARPLLNEAASEAAFIKRFFHDLWGYSLQGDSPDGAYQCHPQFPVARAGQAGGTGAADLALGEFVPGAPAVPQALCEFKDIKSGLDAPQNRKLNPRSPVRQAFDYLRESRANLSGNELVEPTWAIATDMNEFRLYHYTDGLAQCQRFVIASREAADQPLLADDEGAACRRFVFRKIFAPASLLAARGAPPLAKLLKNQITHERDIEEDFYREYRAYRQHLYQTIAAANPGFPGTRGKLVRLTQRLLDRCLFILFCEDMGRSLEFPPNLYRDELIAHSLSELYGPDDSFPWDRLKSIFRAMDKGGILGKHTINRFNGGLFEPLPELENLHIPAHLFCAENQGQNADTLLAHPLTLLHFSVKYNFGVKEAGRGRVIDFYALGRIFEQSITELEILEAEADGRDSLNLLTKRKRDGVYYTPEWVTAYLVAETLGTQLATIKNRMGLAPENRPDAGDLELYRAFLNDRRRAAPRAGAWLAALQNYRVELGRVRVLDPACGSGAFLIQTLEFLKAEHRWVADETARVEGQSGLWDADSVVNAILSRNLYGVDINPESVEIAKLALWMHTATPGKPLSSLDHNLQCGNSLVGKDFHELNPAGLFSDEELERVNAFDWRAAFPEAFRDGGFDCVLGNPPYVKLQHFRRVQAKVAEYLVNAKTPDGQPLYASTQSGNFDLYLPFIEKGISLLKPGGRMGFIAPNLWMMNEYGAPLRQLVQQRRQLERWIDFKSFQVFREAITYTALQFFTQKPNPAIRCAFAHDGDLARLDWNLPDAEIPYEQLPEHDAWNLMPDLERKLINKLKSQCKPLGDPQWTQQIFQGVKTSMDTIYLLERIRDSDKPEIGIYAQTGSDADGLEHKFEDALMLPLVTGKDAKRYEAPSSTTFVLFPYDLSTPKPTVSSAAKMESKFPCGMKYLNSFETKLRAREHNGFDDNEWYRFGRNQGLGKQSMPKLGVATTAPGMRVFYDPIGEYVFLGARAEGVIPHSLADGWYLLGILNSPTVDFVFKRLGRPKEGGYFEANKQFIAPLPVPEAGLAERGRVAEFAERLQGLHTRRRDLGLKLERRLNSAQTVAAAKSADWLWADLRDLDYWKSVAPADLPAKAKTAWAKERRQTILDTHMAELDARLRPGSRLEVVEGGDELSLAINGVPAITLYDQPDTPSLAAQWRHAIRGIRVTEAFDGKKLLKLLLELRTIPDPNLAAAILATDREITSLDADIAAAESALNALTYQLYQLSPEEIRLVEQIPKKGTS